MTDYDNIIIEFGTDVPTEVVRESFMPEGIYLALPEKFEMKETNNGKPYLWVQWRVNKPDEYENRIVFDKLWLDMTKDFSKRKMESLCKAIGKWGAGARTSMTNILKALSEVGYVKIRVNIQKQRVYKENVYEPENGVMFYWHRDEPEKKVGINKIQPAKSKIYLKDYIPVADSTADDGIELDDDIMMETDELAGGLL